MLDELEIKLIKKLNYIPDALLTRYLEGKLLVKPFYATSVGPTTVPSRYEEYKANMKSAAEITNKRNKPRS